MAWLNHSNIIYGIPRNIAALQLLTHCHPGTLNRVADLGQHWISQWLVIADVDLPLSRSCGIHSKTIFTLILKQSLINSCLKFAHLKSLHVYLGQWVTQSGIYKCNLIELNWGNYLCHSDIRCHYSALPIYDGHLNNSRKTPMAHPLGRGMDGFREFEMWPQFYLQICCALLNIVLYFTAIYRDSIVSDWWLPNKIGMATRD